MTFVSGVLVGVLAALLFVLLNLGNIFDALLDSFLKAITGKGLPKKS